MPLKNLKFQFAGISVTDESLRLMMKRIFRNSSLRIYVPAGAVLAFGMSGLFVILNLPKPNTPFPFEREFLSFCENKIRDSNMTCTMGLLVSGVSSELVA